MRMTIQNKRYWLRKSVSTALAIFGLSLTNAKAQEPQVLCQNNGLVYPIGTQIDACTQLIDKPETITKDGLLVALNSRAVALMNIKNYLAAIDDFKSAIQIRPNDSNLFFNLGLAHFDAQHYELAIDVFSSALKLQPDRPDVLTGRGLAFSVSKRSFEALSDFDNALKIDPKYQKALFGRAETYRDMKLYRDAVVDYNRIIDANPHDQIALDNRGIVFQQWGKASQAIADFKQALKLDPKFGQAYFNLGTILAEQTEYEAAVENYNAALHLQPNDPFALANRGSAFYRLGLIDKALLDYNASLDARPEHAVIYYLRGLIWLAKDDFNKAGADFGNAVRYLPVEPKFRLAKALAELEINSVPRLDDGPANVAIPKWIAATFELYSNKSPDVDLKSLGLSAEDSCEAAFFEGEFFRLKKQYDHAKRIFDDAIAACPRNAILYRASALQRQKLN